MSTVILEKRTYKFATV